MEQVRRLLRIGHTLRKVATCDPRFTMMGAVYLVAFIGVLMYVS